MAEPIDVAEPDDLPDDEAEAVSTAEKLGQHLTRLVGSVVDNGVGPITGSVAWAEDRLARVQGDRYDPSQVGSRKPLEADRDEVEKVIAKLIKESVAAAGANGFVTGLGGFITLPVTVPANLAGALIVNARLAGAIAYLRGYPVDDPQTRTVLLLVVLGSGAQQAARTLGIKVGHKAGEQALKKLPVVVLREINRKVGFMLVAKYGTKRAAVTLAKAIPLLGGVAGGAIDATLTAAVGKAAKSMFPHA